MWSTIQRRQPTPTNGITWRFTTHKARKQAHAQASTVQAPVVISIGSKLGYLGMTWRSLRAIATSLRIVIQQVSLNLMGGLLEWLVKLRRHELKTWGSASQPTRTVWFFTRFQALTRSHRFRPNQNQQPNSHPHRRSRQRKSLVYMGLTIFSGCCHQLQSRLPIDSYGIPTRRIGRSQIPTEYGVFQNPTASAMLRTLISFLPVQRTSLAP